MTVAYNSAGAIASSASAATLTPVLPAHVIGDMLVVLLGVANNATVNTPAGWSKRSEVNSGASFRVTIYSKIAVSAADANPVFTWTGSAACAAQALRYTGVSTPAGFGASTASSGTANIHTTASINSTAPSSFIIALDVQSSATAQTTTPAGWTGNLVNADATSAISFAAYSKGLVATGSASGAISQSESSTTPAWVQFQFELLNAGPITNQQVGVYNQVIGAAWAPTPIVTVNTLQILTAVGVDNPPPSVRQPVFGWEPDPAPYQFFGGRAPFMPACLPPSVVAVPVSNPPVALGQDQRPYDNWWIPSDPSPQLTVKLSRGPPTVAAVPSGLNISQEIISYGIPDTPSIIKGGQLAPALLAVRVDNPPFGIPPRLGPAILGAWTPPDAQAPVAGALNPAISRVLVNNPPFGLPPRSAAILTAWVPPDPSPIVNINVSPALSAVAVNNPPFGVPPLSQRTILEAWQPAPAQAPTAGALNPFLSAVAVNNPPIPSMAGNELAAGGLWPALPDPLPVLPRYLPASITAVAVNNPPFALPVAVRHLATRQWVDPDPLPILPRNLLPQLPPPILLNNSSLPIILSAWLADNIQINPRGAIPVGVRVDNPPFGIPSPALSAIVAAWIAPDAQAPAAGKLPVSATTVPVNNPPFGLPPLSLAAILTAWLPPDPAAPVGGKLSSAISGVPANAPPPSNPGALNSALLSWVAPDPGPTVPRISPPQPIVAAIPTSAAAWLEAVLLAWAPDSAAAVAARPLSPTVEAVAVNNPPGLRPDRLNTIVAAWVQDDPVPVAPRYTPQAPAAASTLIASTQLAASAILAAWAAPDAPAPTARLLNPVFEAVRVDAPPISGSATSTPALIDALAAWQLIDPAPFVSRPLPPAQAAANPPFRAPLDAILASWVQIDQAPLFASHAPSLGVRVDNPPARRPDRLDSTVAAWVQLDPAPQTFPHIVQGAAALAQFVPASQSAVLGIVAAWAAQDAPPPFPRPLNPAFEAVPVNNPPFAGAATTTPALLEALAAWTTADFAIPAVARLAQPAAPLPPVPTTAPQLAIIASWAQEAPLVAPRTLIAAFARSVDNPPRLGASSANAALAAAWTPLDQYVAPQRTTPQAAPAIVLTGLPSWFSAVMAAWAAPEFAFVAPRVLQVPAGAPFVAPLSLAALQTILNAWIESPAFFVQQPKFTQGLRVDVPPVSSKLLAQAAIVDIWLAPSGLLPILPPITVLPPGLPLAIDPRYIIHYPVGPRVIHHPKG